MNHCPVATVVSELTEAPAVWLPSHADIAHAFHTQEKPDAWLCQHL